MKDPNIHVLILLSILLMSAGVNLFLIKKYITQSKVINYLNSYFDVNKERSNVTVVDSGVVFYLNGNQVVKLSPETHSDSDAEIGVPDQLLINKGTYNFFGESYNLNKQGLYRFVIPGKMNMQRVVFNNDLDALLSAISWIVTHGNTDNHKSHISLSNNAMSSKLYLTCGCVSEWAHYLLNSFGFKSRIVAGLTLDQWNTYDNGHTMLEVWWDKQNKWALYDLDNNKYFVSEDDKPVRLSLLEFVESVINDNYQIINISSGSFLDVSGFNSSTGFNNSFLMEEINVNMVDWYRRVMQVPLIFEKEKKLYVFMDLKNKRKVESYSTNYKYIDHLEFMTKFYNVDN